MFGEADPNVVGNTGEPYADGFLTQLTRFNTYNSEVLVFSLSLSGPAAPRRLRLFPIFYVAPSRRSISVFLSRVIALLYLVSVPQRKLAIFCNDKVIAAPACKGCRERRSSAFTAGLSRTVLSVYVMSADLVASLQICDVTQMWYLSDLSKKLFLDLATTKHQQLCGFG